jgi:hypothetical protein
MRKPEDDDVMLSPFTKANMLFSKRKNLVTFMSLMLLLLLLLLSLSDKVAGVVVSAGGLVDAGTIGYGLTY